MNLVLLTEAVRREIRAEEARREIQAEVARREIHAEAAIPNQTPFGGLCRSRESNLRSRFVAITAS